VPTVFTDSNFLIALAHAGDQYGVAARSIESALRTKNVRFQDFLLSDYILIEVFHKLQGAIGFAPTLTFHRRLLNEARIRPLGRNDLDKAIATKLQPFLNARTAQPPIGLVDATSLVVMEREKVPRIVSFDEGFDNIPNIRRISSVEGVSEIL